MYSIYRIDTAKLLIILPRLIAHVPKNGKTGTHHKRYVPKNDKTGTRHTRHVPEKGKTGTRRTRYVFV